MKQLLANVCPFLGPEKTHKTEVKLFYFFSCVYLIFSFLIPFMNIVNFLVLPDLF
uniref:Uncharacterized protein n=1 Tax=Anguilla anguilla TaxID=7936 RepID=A0A0E9V079_ANGAN